MVKIALDAMGGDNAPTVVIEGAIRAVNELQGKLGVVLTGPEEVVRAELTKFGEENNPWIEIVHAPDLVEMDESPATVLKTKSESGLVKCVALQKAGLVQASMSAGSSGAMMAACLMILGRIGKIARPAIACLMPSKSGTTVLLDCGANVDEKASTLLDFAVCGSVYSSHMLGHDNPTVGLLNIGEEDKKGSEVIQETFGLLKESNLNFYGNIEGGDVIQGTTNVIVCSGFVGNIVLKLMEGFYDFHISEFGEMDTEAGRRFSKGWDYDNFGGALLLGLKGTGFIAHGRANATAIYSGLKTVAGIAEKEITQKVADALVGPSK
jgi:glycerol-3-phosphate acyltransferase PlsX